MCRADALCIVHRSCFWSMNVGFAQGCIQQHQGHRNASSNTRDAASGPGIASHCLKLQQVSLVCIPLPKNAASVPGAVSHCLKMQQSALVCIPLLKTAANVPEVASHCPRMQQMPLVCIPLPKNAASVPGCIPQPRDASTSPGQCSPRPKVLQGCFKGVPGGCLAACNRHLRITRSKNNPNAGTWCYSSGARWHTEGCAGRKLVPTTPFSCIMPSGVVYSNSNPFSWLRCINHNALLSR